VHGANASTTGSFVMRPVGARQQKGRVVVKLWVEPMKSLEQNESLGRLPFKEAGCEEAREDRSAPRPLARSVPCHGQRLRPRDESRRPGALISTFDPDAIETTAAGLLGPGARSKTGAARNIIGEHLTMRGSKAGHHYGQ